MGQPKPPRATVSRKGLMKGGPPAFLTTCDAICAAGATCPQVVASSVASQLLADLKAATSTFRASFTQRGVLATALKTQIGVAHGDELAGRTVLGTYLTFVNQLAGGDATILHSAGLPSRADKPAVVLLGTPAGLSFTPGKKSGQAIVRWHAGPGASSYALEVNFAPNTPGSPWTALSPGRSRRRVLVAPAPGAQFLVRVASIGSEVQSDWSPPLMVTAL